MDNRRLYTTMILTLILFFAWQFLFNKPVEKKQQAKAKAAVDFYQPTGNPRQFLTLGNLSENTDSPLMVTLDSRGASVRRIEMVQRDDSGRFIIRELENKSGYLGYLELRTDSKPGAVIRCLPTGSPLFGASAQWNGTTIQPQVGDRLISINGTRIASDESLHQFLAETEPGQNVEIEMARLLPGTADDATAEELADLAKDSATTEAEANDSSTPGSEAAESNSSDSESSGNADADSVNDGTAASESETTSVVSALPANWETYSVSVALMPRPKKMLGPEYQNTEGWSGVYPSSLELTLQAANQINWKDLDKAMRLDNWKSFSGTDQRGPYVRFTYDLPAKALAPLIEPKFQQESAEGSEETAGEDLPGGEVGDEPAMRVTKTFRLPSVTGDEKSDPNVPAYHFDMEVAIENLTDKNWDLGYKLNGPVGTSIEGWWYQVKVHGGTWKFFYGAGARDVLVSTKENRYTFYGRPQITQGNKPFPIISSDADVAGRDVNYVALDTHYFNSALMPLGGEDDSDGFVCYSGFASAAGAPPKKDRKSQVTADVTYRLYKKLSLEPSQEYRQSFRVFAGPKRPELLDEYQLGAAVNYGWFGWFSRPLLWMLHLFYSFLGSYGLAIILLTVIVKIAVMPISRKALANAQMMQLLQPEIKKINEQYKEDMAQRQLATSQLFKRVNYNPLNGCILMPLQIPIFLGLYRGLSVDFALRDQPLIPGLEWCSNLAGPDQLLNWSGFLPAFLAGEDGFLGPYLNILPLIAVVFFIIQQRMFTPPAMDEQQQMMQKMMSFMMIMMAFMFFKVPAGLCVYIITSSMWSLVERTMIPKPQLPQKIVDSINRELAADGVVEGTVIDRPSGGATKLDDEAKRELRDREKDRRRRLRDRQKDN